jgi:hypothetical protein
MKIKNWEQFILESILITSGEFKNYLFEIGDEISSKLMGLIDRDVKTNYNFLDISDEQNKISFVSDSQAQRKISQGVDLQSIFNKNNKTTIGRVIKGILSDNNISVTDRQVEEFVNKFKAKWESKNIKEDSIRIVSGEDIRFWYLVDNYCDETMSLSRGSLGKSCMKYSECQSFFDIYVNNPKQVSMVIFTEMDGEEEKLRARALLWETTEGTYRDRTYFTLDSEVTMINDWLDKNLGRPYNKINVSTAEVKLDSGGYFDEYPYMDSFCFYRPEVSTLSIFEPNGKFLILHETDGSWEDVGMVYSELFDTEYDKDEAIWSQAQGSYILEDESVFSEYLNSHIHQDYAIKSEKYGWLLEELANTVYLNKEKTKEDYYPNDKMCEEYDGYINEDGDLEYYEKSIKPDLESIQSKFDDFLDNELIKREEKSSDGTVLYFMSKENLRCLSVSLDSKLTYGKMASSTWHKIHPKFKNILNPNYIFGSVIQLLKSYFSKKSGNTIDKIYFVAQI